MSFRGCQLHHARPIFGHAYCLSRRLAERQAVRKGKPYTLGPRWAHRVFLPKPSETERRLSAAIRSRCLEPRSHSTALRAVNGLNANRYAEAMSSRAGAEALRNHSTLSARNSHELFGPAALCELRSSGRRYGNCLVFSENATHIQRCRRDPWWTAPSIFRFWHSPSPAK
jgi:hypothetical protein